MDVLSVVVFQHGVQLTLYIYKINGRVRDVPMSPEGNNCILTPNPVESLFSCLESKIGQSRHCLPNVAQTRVPHNVTASSKIRNTRRGSTGLPPPLQHVLHSKRSMSTCGPLRRVQSIYFSCQSDGGKSSYSDIKDSSSSSGLTSTISGRPLSDGDRIMELKTKNARWEELHIFKGFGGRHCGHVSYRHSRKHFTVWHTLTLQHMVLCGVLSLYKRQLQGKSCRIYF